MNDTPIIIDIRNISFSYGENEVLKDVTFSVPQSDYLGIVGGNGAGKTTLLKIILGLVRPTKGSVELFGEPLDRFKEWSKIGYVPQKVTNFDELFPVSVMDVVLMGRYGRAGIFRRIGSRDRERASQALRDVGMEEFHDRRIGDLSGGQQQRVFIARALAGEPEVIFLDEPTVGIDQRSSEEFYTLLRKMNQDLGLTLVLISHDIETVVKEAKHIACMDKTLICHSIPEEFIKNTRSSELLDGEVKIITHTHHHV